MISERKAAANRNNGRKSHGPKTAEGKNIARRNALKHGLTAEKLVVLGEDAEEFQCMADAHRAAFRPQNAAELALANTFSLAEWRRQRCASTEATMTNQYIRDRALNEQEGREDDVLNVGRRLFHDKQGRWRLYPDPIAETESTFTREERPLDLDAPERLLRDLESTYSGCRWLLDRWCELKTHYHSEGGWRPYDMFKLIRLIGKQPIELAEDPSGDLLAIFLACHKLDDADESPFCKLKCELDDDQYPDIKQRMRESGLEARGPSSREQARAILDELFERHTRRLARIARKHKADDRAEARERLRRLAFDPGQEADKVRRYEDIAVRRMTRVCEELIKLRRAGILDEAADCPLPASPHREEGARRAGEGHLLEYRVQAVPGPAKAGTPTGGAGAGTSPSPRRGEGARRAGEGAREEHRQEGPTYEPDNVRLESLTYESGVRQDSRNSGEPQSFVQPNSPAAEQRSEPTTHNSRSAFQSSGGLLNVWLLMVGLWWLVAGGQQAALSQSQLCESGPGRQTVSEPDSNRRTEFIPFDCDAAPDSVELLDQSRIAGKRNEFRSTKHFAEPAAQNEPMAQQITNDKKQITTLARDKSQTTTLTTDN
jgi:hypothetical protein